MPRLWIPSVDVDLDERTRRCLQRVGVHGKIRHGEVHDQSAAVPQTAVGTAPRGDLLVEPEEMRQRRAGSNDEVERFPALPIADVRLDKRQTRALRVTQSGAFTEGLFQH